MVNSEIYLEFLQGLLLRTEIVNICVRNIIGFTEQCIRIAIYDPLTEIIKFGITITEISCIQYMIIVTTTVEAYQTKFHEFGNILRSWIDHSYTRFSSFNLVVYEKKIRKYLDVEKCKSFVSGFYRLALTFRLEFHAVHKFDAIVCMIRTITSELKYPRFHVRYVVSHSARICVVEHFLDKVHTRFCSRMIGLMKILLDSGAKSLFALHDFLIYHILFLLGR